MATTPLKTRLHLESDRKGLGRYLVLRIVDLKPERAQSSEYQSVAAATTSSAFSGSR